MGSIAIVILAAGASRRFGSPKQLAVFRGKTFIRRMVDEVSAIAAVDNYVVLGAYAEQIQPSLVGSATQVIVNSHWQTGMASSIRSAVAALGASYRAIMFVAVDQIYIDRVGLAALIDQYQCQKKQQSAPIVCAEYSTNRYGIPAIFAAEYFTELAELTGDAGAKPIMRQYRDRVTMMPWPDAAVDIDTVAALLTMKNPTQRLVVDRN